MRMSSGRKMRQPRICIVGGASRQSRSTSAQQAIAGTPRDREQPCRERRHRPQAFRPAGTAAAAFPEPHRRCRPRGNCARHSGGHRAAPPRSATPALSRRRRARLRSARDRSGWPRPMRVMTTAVCGRPWRTSGRIRKIRSRSRPRRHRRSDSRSACRTGRAARTAIIADASDRPHRPLPARQVLAIKHRSSFGFSERTHDVLVP